MPEQNMTTWEQLLAPLLTVLCTLLRELLKPLTQPKTDTCEDAACPEGRYTSHPRGVHITGFCLRKEEIIHPSLDCSTISSQKGQKFAKNPYSKYINQSSAPDSVT